MPVSLCGDLKVDFSVDNMYESLHCAAVSYHLLRVVRKRYCLQICALTSQLKEKTQSRYKQEKTTNAKRMKLTA